MLNKCFAILLIGVLVFLGHVHSLPQNIKYRNKPELHTIPKRIKQQQNFSHTTRNVSTQNYMNDIEYDLRLRQLMEELVLGNHSGNLQDINSEENLKANLTQEVHYKDPFPNSLSQNSSSSIKTDSYLHDPQRNSFTEIPFFSYNPEELMVGAKKNLTKIANENPYDAQKIRQRLQFLQKNVESLKNQSAEYINETEAGNILKIHTTESPSYFSTTQYYDISQVTSVNNVVRFNETFKSDTIREDTELSTNIYTEGSLQTKTEKNVQMPDELDSIDSSIEKRLHNNSNKYFNVVVTEIPSTAVKLSLKLIEQDVSVQNFNLELNKDSAATTEQVPAIEQLSNATVIYSAATPNSTHNHKFPFTNQIIQSPKNKPTMTNTHELHYNEHQSAVIQVETMQTTESQFNEEESIFDTSESIDYDLPTKTESPKYTTELSALETTTTTGEKEFTTETVTVIPNYETTEFLSEFNLFSTTPNSNNERAKPVKKINSSNSATTEVPINRITSSFTAAEIPNKQIMQIENINKTLRLTTEGKFELESSGSISYSNANSWESVTIKDDLHKNDFENITRDVGTFLIDVTYQNNSQVSQKTPEPADSFEYFKIYNKEICRTNSTAVAKNNSTETISFTEDKGNLGALETKSNISRSDVSKEAAQANKMQTNKQQIVYNATKLFENLNEEEISETNCTEKMQTGCTTTATLKNIFSTKEDNLEAAGNDSIENKKTLLTENMNISDVAFDNIKLNILGNAAKDASAIMQNNKLSSIPNTAIQQNNSNQTWNHTIPKESTEIVKDIDWLTQTSSYQKPSNSNANVSLQMSVTKPLIRVPNEPTKKEKEKIFKPSEKPYHLSALSATIGNSLHDDTQKSEHLQHGNDTSTKIIKFNKNTRKQNIGEEVTATVNCHTANILIYASPLAMSTQEYKGRMKTESNINNWSAVIEKSIENDKQNIEKWPTFKNNKLNNDSLTKSGNHIIKENASADDMAAAANTDADADVNKTVNSYANADDRGDDGNDEGTSIFSNEKNMRLVMKVNKRVDKNENNDRVAKNRNKGTGSIIRQQQKEHNTSNIHKVSQARGGINEMSTIENKLLDISKHNSNITTEMPTSSYDIHENFNNKNTKRDNRNKGNQIIKENVNNSNNLNSKSEMKTSNKDNENDDYNAADNVFQNTEDFKRPKEKIRNMFDNLPKKQSFPAITSHHSDSKDNKTHTNINKNISVSAQTKEEITATNWWHSLPYAEIRKFLNSIFDSVTSNDDVGFNGSVDSMLAKLTKTLKKRKTVSAAVAKATVTSVATNNKRIETIKERKPKNEEWQIWILNNIWSSLLL